LDSQTRVYYPYVSPFDPCPPIRVKTYVVPPILFMNFQPPGLPQFSAHEALRHGVLWPALYSRGPKRRGRGRYEDEEENQTCGFMRKNCSTPYA
jgi:spore coat protein JA